MSETRKTGHEALVLPFSKYLAPAGLAVAVAAGLAEILAGPGSRLGMWHFRTGFELLKIAAVGGSIGAALSFLAGIVAGSRVGALRMAVAGIIIGLVAVGIPWSWSRTASRVPRIHDITTDTTNPPLFSAILGLRRNAENAPEYGGPSVAEQQVRAYPDIQPLVHPAAPAGAFNRALTVGRDMGWEIVSSDPGQGRIEATATTFWFGFKDDIVVRITPLPEGSRVDVRSVSRVGKSDVGTNAARVRLFLEKMRDAKER